MAHCRTSTEASVGLGGMTGAGVGGWQVAQKGKEGPDHIEAPWGATAGIWAEGWLRNYHGYGVENRQWWGRVWSRLEVRRPEAGGLWAVKDGVARWARKWTEGIPLLVYFEWMAFADDLDMRCEKKSLINDNSLTLWIIYCQVEKHVFH